MNTLTNVIWLPAEVLNRNSTVSSYHGDVVESWKRPYEYWSHAEETLSKANTEFHLVDVVTSLNRGITNRLKSLNDIYRFKEIPLGQKPDKILDQLEFFGIIRPFMLERLIDVRNHVEHAFITPPNKDRCREFVEFTWYFLRSTDGLARQVVNSYDLYDSEEEESPYALEILTGPFNEWKIEVRGLVRSMSKYLVERVGNLRIVLAEARARESEDDQIRGIGTSQRVDEFYIIGSVTGPGEQIKRLVDIYFSVL